METDNLVKAFEKLRTALIEFAKRFCELVLAKVKEVWALVKEAYREIEEREPEQAMLYLWQEQQQLHQHQVINRMKVQERIMISYQQPWKAWKAQRR
jgi:hypothetical protein